MCKSFFAHRPSHLLLLIVYAILTVDCRKTGKDNKKVPSDTSLDDSSAHPRGGRGFGKIVQRPTLNSVSDAFNVTLGPVLDEAEAARMTNAMEPWISEMNYLASLAGWEFATNMTPENEQASTQASLDHTTFHRNKFYPLYAAFNWRKFKDPKLRRRFRAETLLGSSALSDERLKNYIDLSANMTKIYSMAKICDFQDREKCEKRLDPDLTTIMSTSRDPEELLYYWKAWRDATGRQMPQQYSQYVEIANEVASLNGYHDMGAYWRRPYEDAVMPLHLWTLYGQILPLYEQVHAYARRRLLQKFGKEWIPSTRGTIPAHLLGNMWAQNWYSMWDVLAPYPVDSKDGAVANFDVTDALVKANYTVLGMVQSADKFFTSLGLLPGTAAFWNGSIFERVPEPRQMVCHAEAFDFHPSQKDYRIKMCATVNMRDFITVHHEMGHIQYYMQYSDQPDTFREGANPAFHEAIGDTISMSVASPSYLESLGLLPNYVDNDQNKINYLMIQALKVLVDLPWALVLEQWRWDVFSGMVNVTQYNCHWWDLRSRFQGIKPPVKRSYQDFDPGAKYHVPSGVPYDRYFVARLLTYQFHEALCKEAGQYSNKGGKPLHLCSIYGSKAAGKKLSAMLKLGSSLPWPDALEKLTGTRKLDAKSVLNYFAPLEQWLKDENKRNGDEPGWEDEAQEDLCTPEYPLP